MTYKLGQTIYVVKGNTIQPVLVVEEIVKKTMNGSEVTYLVRHKNNAPVSLMDVGTEAFDDAKSAKKTLIERATNAINLLIDEATKNAKEWYSSSQQETKEKETIVAQIPREFEMVNDGCQIVTMPDGTKARVRMG